MANDWLYRDAAMLSMQCYIPSRANALPQKICCGQNGCRVYRFAKPGRRAINNLGLKSQAIRPSAF